MLLLYTGVGGRLLAVSVGGMIMHCHFVMFACAVSVGGMIMHCNFVMFT